MPKVDRRKWDARHRQRGFFPEHPCPLIAGSQQILAAGRCRTGCGGWHRSTCPVASPTRISNHSGRHLARSPRDRGLGGAEARTPAHHSARRSRKPSLSVRPLGCPGLLPLPAPAAVRILRPQSFRTRSAALRPTDSVESRAALAPSPALSAGRRRTARSGRKQRIADPGLPGGLAGGSA